MGLKSVFKRSEKVEPPTALPIPTTTKVHTLVAFDPASLTTTETIATIRHREAASAQRSGGPQHPSKQQVSNNLTKPEEATRTARCDECRRRQETCVACYMYRTRTRLASHPDPLRSHPETLLLCEPTRLQRPRVHFAAGRLPPRQRRRTTTTLVLGKSGSDAGGAASSDSDVQHEREVFFSEVHTVGIAVIQRGAKMVDIPPMNRRSCTVA